MASKALDRRSFLQGTAAVAVASSAVSSAAASESIRMGMIGTGKRGGAHMRRLVKREDVKIIAVSGGGSTQHADFLDMAKKLGADRVFAKPVDLNELADAVETLIGDYGSRS